MQGNHYNLTRSELEALSIYYTDPKTTGNVRWSDFEKDMERGRTLISQPLLVCRFISKLIYRLICKLFFIFIFNRCCAKKLQNTKNKILRIFYIELELLSGWLTDGSPQ